MGILGEGEGEGNLILTKRDIDECIKLAQDLNSVYTIIVFI